MTNGMLSYFTLNQLLLGKQSKDCPDVVQKYLDDNELRGGYDYDLKIPVKRRHPIEQLFINMLRVPDYSFNVPKGKEYAMGLDQVASAVRSNDFDTKTCEAYALWLITGVAQDGGNSTYFSDGVLHLGDKALDEKPDLEAMLSVAFARYCWGVPNATKEQKDLIRKVESYVDIKGDVSFSPTELAKIIAGFGEHKVNPMELGYTMFKLHDLAITYQQFHALCSWMTEMHNYVKLIVPRGAQGNTIVGASLPFADFVRVAEGEGGTLEEARAKGEVVTFGKAKA